MIRRSKTQPPAAARLFVESNSHAPTSGVYVANIDGASRGNPGPASYAVVVRNPSGKVILEHAKNIGRETNNVAEYYALLAALDYAASHSITALRIRSDSELLVRQMQGRYKVKSADLRPLHERAIKLSKQLTYFQIEHVRRELNCDADALANVALDRGGMPKLEKQGSGSQRQQNEPASEEIAEPEPDGFTAISGLRPLTLQARIVRGVLVPSEPLDFPDGTQVQVTLHIPQKS
ncbi:MAG: ribonuclease HI family protein [Candidatus Acidiferrales bacterium]